MSYSCGHFVTDLFASLASLGFFFFFWCGPFLKCSLNFLKYCFCFMCFGFLAVTRDWTCIPALEGEVLTTAPPWKSLVFLLSVCFLKGLDSWTYRWKSTYFISVQIDKYLHVEHLHVSSTQVNRKTTRRQTSPLVSSESLYPHLTVTTIQLLTA